MQEIPLLLPSLVFLLTAGLCRCIVHCPAECRGPGWVVVPGKGLEKFEGPEAQAIMTIIKRVQMVRPGVTTVKVTINGHELQVPSSSKVTIQDIIQRFPDLGETLSQIIQGYSTVRWPSQQPETENQKPWLPEEPEQVGTPQIPFVPQHLVPDIFKTPSPPQPQVPEVPAPTFPPQVPEEPVTPPRPQAPEVPQAPKEPQVPVVPEVTNVPQVPGVPEVPEPPQEPTVVDHTPFDVESYLDLLQKNPDFFVPIYWMLVRHGVTFPDLTKPVTWVIVHGKKVRFQKPVYVRYVITVNNHKFELPKDSRKFADFISSYPDLLPQVATVLQQFGATLITTASGQITGYKLFNKVVRLRTPVKTTVTINGNVFELPRDIVGLVGAIQNSPKALHVLLPLLTSYGVRTRKGPSGEIQVLTYSGHTYPVGDVSPVQVTIDNTQFSIPADLNRILSQPNKFWIGQLLAELQKQHVPLTVDPQTGNLVGIVVNQVPIPFPVIVRLRVRIENRYFNIPKDIPAMLNYLKTSTVGVPTELLNDLYNLYGILPVRNSDRLVVAIEFNGKRYPVPQQKTTTLVVDGQTFLLPRDNAKLADILVNHQIQIKDFLLQIQLAGYKLLAGPDGVLSSVQKGFEIFQLPVTIRLVVTINNDRYRIPSDLPNLVAFMNKPEHSHVVEQIINNLIELGVQVRRDDGKIVLVFNGREYNVNGGGGSPPQVAPQEPTMRIQFNGKWFKVPEEFGQLVATVRAGGPQAISFLVKSLKAHNIVVNLTPDGDIASIVFRGKTYAFPLGGGSGGTAGGTLTSGNVEITIRGQKFLIPRDLGVLPTRVRNFQYGELVVALHRLGIMLAVDDRGNFFGMRVGGRLVKFGLTFRVAVILDKSGSSFGVPHQLGALAQGLASGNWNWSAVRRVLFASGVEVRGGATGAPREIGFQGKFYRIQRSVKG
ncbi:unnamed protein product [Ixodes hexagonus]